jgi:MFS family permease
MASRLPGLSVPPAARRRAVVMADQAASSLSNVVVAILVARSVSASAFGAFGLAMVVCQIVLGIVRSLVGEPFIGRHAADPAAVRRERAADLLAATLVLAAATAVLTAAAAALVGGLAGSALVALAVVLPLVVVQDTWRFVFVVDRPGAALGIDGLWLVLVCAALPMAPAGAGVDWFIVAWGLAGGVAAVVGTTIVRAPLRRLHPWRWLRESRPDGGRYLGDFLTAQASGQFAFVLLGAVGSLATLGAVRASQVFYGPLNTIHSGVYLAVVPDGARLRTEPRRLERLIVWTSVALAALALAWMAVGVALPGSVGRQLFDRTWPGADELMIPMGLSAVAGGVMAGGFFGIRSLGAADASLRSRLLSAPGQLLLPVVGAILGDAIGFALGAAAGRVLASGIWWSAFRRLVRAEGAAGTQGPRPRPSTPDAGDVDATLAVVAAGQADGD